MHFWYILNPFGAITLESQILSTFLKVVFDPYWDGKQQSLDLVI
jgi:hypothetical protein